MKSETFKLLAVLGSLVLMIAALAVCLTFLERVAVHTDVSSPSLGDVYVFPDGWEPVTCSDQVLTDGNCSWVCGRFDGQRVYRECQPVIEHVATEQVQRLSNGSSS